MEFEKLREFFVHHIEKLILVLVVAASGLLLYRGLQQEVILESHQPGRLVADANQVRAAIDEDRNEAVLRDRHPRFEIPKEIKLIAPGPPAPPLGPPHGTGDRTRRSDPVLVAPQALQVQGVLAPIALRSTDGKYAIQELTAADPVEAEPERIPRQTRRGRRGSEQIEEPFEMEMDLSLEELDPGLNVMIGNEPAPSRRLKHALGMRPAPTRHLLNNKLQPPVPGVGWFIAGTAVMPHKVLHKSYKDAFAFAEGYDPLRRDRPRYLNYELQRADVTGRSVDRLQNADWVKRDGRLECIRDAILKWSGFAPEIVPADYREDATLTMWIPPVMFTDYSTFCLHPLIPMLSQRQIEARLRKRANRVLPPEEVANRIIVVDGGQARRDLENEMGVMDDNLRPPQKQGDTTAVDYKLIRFYDFAADPQDADAPKPGRKYVYRVRVAVEDPNFPQNPALQPTGRNLNPIVFDRVMGLVANLKVARDPVKQRSIESQRWTDWSRPSDPVSLPGPDNVYVGPAVKPKTRKVRVGNRVVDYESMPAAVNLVISRFSAKYGSRISMLMKEVTEGTVLSKRSEAAEVVDPITLEVKQDPAAEIVTDMTVIDIDGGRPLGIHKGRGLVEPSLMLLFDAKGGLVVHEEGDDQERYRAKSFADERGE